MSSKNNPETGKIVDFIKPRCVVVIGGGAPIGQHATKCLSRVFPKINKTPDYQHFNRKNKRDIYKNK